MLSASAGHKRKLDAATEVEANRVPVPRFAIFIQDPGGRRIVIDALPTDTGYTVKQRVEARVGTPRDQSRLFCRGRVVEDDKCLDFYHIAEDDVLQLLWCPEVASASAPGW